MFLAKDILLAVLAFEVKNVNGKSNIFECRIVLDHFCDVAVVVIEDVFRHGSRQMVCLFDHFL